jgi:hypothetical protein
MAPVYIFLLAAGLLLADLAIPFVYAAWRFDRSFDAAQLRASRSRYGLIAFPRSAILIVLVGLVAFAPPSAANNVPYLAAFIGAALGYGAACIFGLSRAFASRHEGGG